MRGWDEERITRKAWVFYMPEMEDFLTVGRTQTVTVLDDESAA